MNPSTKILNDLFRLISEYSFGVGGAIPNSHQGIAFGISSHRDIIHNTCVIGEIRDVGEKRNRYRKLLDINHHNLRRVLSRRNRNRPPRSEKENSFPFLDGGVGLRIGKRFFTKGSLPFPVLSLTCSGLVEMHHHDAFMLALVRIYYEENFLINPFLENCIKRKVLDLETAIAIRKIVKFLLSE